MKNSQIRYVSNVHGPNANKVEKAKGILLILNLLKTIVGSREELYYMH